MEPILKSMQHASRTQDANCEKLPHVRDQCVRVSEQKSSFSPNPLPRDLPLERGFHLPIAHHWPAPPKQSPSDPKHAVTFYGAMFPGQCPSSQKWALHCSWNRAEEGTQAFHSFPGPWALWSQSHTALVWGRWADGQIFILDVQESSVGFVRKGKAAFLLNGKNELPSKELENHVTLVLN